MKKAICFLFLILCNGLFSQENTFEIIEKTPLVAHSFIGVDTQGAWFYMADNVLYKKTANELFNYQDFQLGKMGFVDILNPLKIIVFYPDAQTVVVLDNKLSEIQRVNFVLTPPYLNVAGASAANDNRIWIFNQDTQQLELFNYINKNHLVLSGSIAEPYLLQKSNFNYCYVLTQTSLRGYNSYGSLIERIENTGIQKFDIDQNKIALLVNDQVIILPEDRNPRIFNFNDIAVKDLYLTQDLLYLYDGKFLYKIKLTLN